MGRKTIRRRDLGASDGSVPCGGTWSDRPDPLGGLRRLEGIAPDPPEEGETLPPPTVFARAEAIRLGRGPGKLLAIAPPPERRAAVAAFLEANPDERHRVATSTPRAIRRAMIDRWSAVLTRRAVRTVLDRDPSLSAAGSPHPRELLLGVLCLAVWLTTLWGWVPPILLWTVLFLFVGLLRLLVADGDPPRPASPLGADDLPRCAVLVAVYREAAVIADLVAALSRLDYPGDRLEIRLVVEADDEPTLAAAEAATAATAIDLVVVPPSWPRTKPKALNFALATVDADFVAVYDAEDRPDPDQLRRAMAVFAAGPPDLAVVQAALDIDHADRDRPWLVRQFEIEYAMLFHGLLPWLAERRRFLPLGGTSNHFRRIALDAVGGWDPHNVTEDADVSVRLRRAGWRAGVVASVTREEAPATPSGWLAQRTRWMKGWMQTWFAHMRTPLRLHRELGAVDSLLFHLIFAGQLLSALAYLPSLVFLALQATGVKPLFVDRTLDDDVLAVASLSVFVDGVLGAFVLAMRVSPRASHRFRLVDVLTMPVYWCGVSIAAYAAVLELVRAPARWNKTEHGLVARRSRGSRPATASPLADPAAPAEAPAIGE